MKHKEIIVNDRMQKGYRYFLTKPVGRDFDSEFCPELTAARTRVWEVLRPYRMKLLRLAPAKFIHFGTTREILELMNGGVDEYHYLGWNRRRRFKGRKRCIYLSPYYKNKYGRNGKQLGTPGHFMKGTQ